MNRALFFRSYEGQFAEFLQHHSLKRLGMLLPVHLCRFGVRPMSWSYFLELLRGTANPYKAVQHTEFVTSSRLRNINLISIDYACRPRLRYRLTLRGLTFAQEPLDFRRECLSHSFSLLVSAFALPIPPGPLTESLRRLTERSATGVRGPKSSDTRSFGTWLDPDTFSAQDDLTSELLRFL